MTVSDKKCKAITKTGKRCKLKANSSEYCHIHSADKSSRSSKTITTKTTLKTTFSQRKRFKHINTVIQLDGMNDDLRNSIWNVINHRILQTHYRESSLDLNLFDDGYDDFSYDIWANFFKKPIDLIPSNKSGILREIYNFYMSCKWYEVYDFLEHVLNYTMDKEINRSVNEVLERELCGYRYVSGRVVDIIDSQELSALENELSDDSFPSVKAHLARALELLSDRKNPDYRNSIKESISAVESLVKNISETPTATLGAAIKSLKKSGKIHLHPALVLAYSNLYGYTSDEDGVRHAMMEEPNLSASDARFFLLACTSFVNYLKSKL